MGRRSAAHTPPTLAARSSCPTLIPRNTKTLQKLRDRAGSFALLQAITAELPADPTFKIPKQTWAPGVTKVRHPTGRERIHFTQNTLETWTAIAASDLPDTVFSTLQTLRSNRQVTIKHQTMPKELTLVHQSHRALLSVHLKLELPFKKPRHAGQHSLARSLRPNINVAVIGVAAETMPTRFEFLVQRNPCSNVPCNTHGSGLTGRRSAPSD